MKPSTAVRQIRYPFAMFWDTVEGDLRYVANIQSRFNERAFVIPQLERKTYEDYLREESFHNPNREERMGALLKLWQGESKKNE